MNTEEKLAALVRCSVLALAHADTLQWLASRAEPERCLPGHVVFEPGEVSTHVYVVASGSLEVRLREDGELVSLLEPGALFGEYAMFAHGVRTAHVMAAAESVLLTLDEQTFRAFLLRCPQATIQLLETAVRRLQRAERHH